MKKYPKLLSIMSSLEMVGWWPLYVRTMSLNMQSQLPFREGLKKVWNFPYLSGAVGFENCFVKMLILLKNDFYTMLFLFFFIQGELGGWVLESMENSILFKGFPKLSKS